MKDTNELIAEFMGMQDTDLGWYDSEEVMSEYACQIVGGGNTFEVLQYDRSWDWLMPVVKKIKLMDVNLEYWRMITNPSNYPIENVHSQVVEFIKEQ